MKAFPVSLSLHEANLIKQALEEFVDPDTWQQDMITEIQRKLFFVE